VGQVENAHGKAQIGSVRGAGGAARAFAYGLKKLSCQAFILNCSIDNAANFARELGMHRARDDIGELNSKAIINAISVDIAAGSEQNQLTKNKLREGIVMAIA
jgi:shikimate 5-dehydrogenase